jgi:hypothetical protein
MHFLIAQLVWIVWAIAFPHFQSPCIKDRKQYVPVNSPYNEAFHDRGLMLSCIIASLIGALLFYFTRSWLQCAFAVPVFVAIYEILFNGIIGLEVYNDFFFIGTSAKHDKWLHKHFPHGDAGEVKLIICLSITLLFNILKNIL